MRELQSKAARGSSGSQSSSVFLVAEDVIAHRRGVERSSEIADSVGVNTGLWGKGGPPPRADYGIGQLNLYSKKDLTP
jgi:hypothetical protein